MTADPHAPEDGRARAGRGESPLERADRNMVELLQELRVAQTGVQILFAFLLSLAFTERFGDIDDVQRWIYVATLLLTAVTTALLVAPAAVHRMLFGRGVKPQTVRLGHRLSLAGLGFLVLTLTGAVLLVLDVAVGRTFAVWAAGGLAVLLAVLWFVVPLPVRRAADEAEDGDLDGHGGGGCDGPDAPARPGAASGEVPPVADPCASGPEPGGTARKRVEHARRALT